ncbi:hypothetical protein [Novacetimonas maltaceti]|uniref:Uncharacterized protein n=1 Tax=Novacetimonas maltaceti TaxID=1203393 RepID=A0A2S3W635_9PROT|nr:hypothetical protein [Novacetimonas maltaceti]POF64297.1 hypothetical protein KMAL_01920 [Novacetimonas maltaceti]
MTDPTHDVTPAPVHLGNRHAAPDYHLGRLVIITMAIACITLFFILQ